MKRFGSVSGRFGSSEEESLLNLTPLIDVVFVVLIIFIVISPMLETERVELASSSPVETSATPPSQSPPFTIYVHENNTIRIDQQEIPISELIPLLRKKRKEVGENPPLLIQDRRAQFGTYQNVKNALETAGFRQLDLLLQPGPS